MRRLLPQKFSIRFEIRRRFFGRKKIQISFQQGTFREILQFREALLTGKIDEFLREFLKIPSRVFRILNFMEKEKIISFLQKTFAKGFFSQDSTEAETPPESVIAFICQHSSETLASLSNLTWSQIEFLFDGIVWNLNSQTKDGRRANQIEQQERKLAAAEGGNFKQKVKEFFAKK